MTDALLILGAMLVWGLLHSLLAAQRVKQVLESQFGRAYQAYQQRVPMLIPWRLPGVS